MNNLNKTESMEERSEQNLLKNFRFDQKHTKSNLSFCEFLIKSG